MSKAKKTSRRSELAETDRLALDVLAATNALWLPDRQPRAHARHTRIHELRMAYHVSGVAVPSLTGASADGAARMRATRTCRRAIRDGLLRKITAKATRPGGLVLTERGFARARALALLPQADPAALRRLASLESSPTAMDLPRMVYGPAGPALEPLVWVSEFVAADVRDTHDPMAGGKLTALEEDLLPALTAGLIVSGSTLRGWIWYAITKAGRHALERGDGAAPSRLPRSSLEAITFYGDALARHSARLTADAVRAPNSVGELPLPESTANPRPGCGKAWRDFWNLICEKKEQADGRQPEAEGDD